MAYSSRYTAEATPIGNESTTTNTPIQKVPLMAWNTPDAAALERRLPERNDSARSENTPTPSMNTS